MLQESIYNLIPKEYIPQSKERMYQSKFNGSIPPSSSTFNNFTTSRPKVNNLYGDFDLHQGPHTHKGLSKSLGKPKGAYKQHTNEFQLKNTGTMGSNELPQIQSYRYDASFKKAEVPKVAEKPIMGLRSNKNYIVTNAVENILAAPKMIIEEQSWTSKKDYGRTPDYLTRIQESITNEYKMIQSLHLNEAEEQDKQKYLMSPEEIDLLRMGLKSKWETVNKEYQSITHIKKIDTVGLKRKKEKCEHDMAQLERDIEKLNKQYIFVDTTK